jgi:hypothetical protein
MSLFSRRSLPVQSGDRFVKVGDPPTKVWVVSRVWETVDGLPHARMESCRHQTETRIISVSALTDPQFFVPAAAFGAETQSRDR